MMSGAVKAATLVSEAGGLQLRAALFHSNPVLERKRRNFWDHKSTYSSRKSRKLHAKHSAASRYECLCRTHISKMKTHHQVGPNSLKGLEEIVIAIRETGGQEEEATNSTKTKDEIEDIFGPAFGGNRNFYWSFAHDEDPQWKRSSDCSNKYRTQWRHQSEDNFDSSSSASKFSGSNVASDRLSLGLEASGPLNLEDVKKAYRACALKWHPDRHQGSSKAIAEEKFKCCSAAYTSLRDKLSAPKKRRKFEFNN